MPIPTRTSSAGSPPAVTPVVFYAGWLFLLSAWRELSQRRLGMDTLIASATLLAWGASVLETVRGGVHVWYDAAVMFVFLLLVARMLEQRARATASAQVDSLARARPAFAVREGPDGERETVPVAALAPGDIACVSVGGVVPADGTANLSFEEALLTGEWTPVARSRQRVTPAPGRERPAAAGEGLARHAVSGSPRWWKGLAQRPALAASASASPIISWPGCCWRRCWSTSAGASMTLPARSR